MVKKGSCALCPTPNVHTTVVTKITIYILGIFVIHLYLSEKIQMSDIPRDINQEIEFSIS